MRVRVFEENKVKSGGEELLGEVVRKGGRAKIAKMAKNKLKLGPWFATPLALMARFKFLRNTPLDLFGYGAHRREERELIAWYRDLASTLAAKLTSENEPEIRAILALPDGIRGYDALKSRSIARVKEEAAQRVATLATSRHANPAPIA